MKIKILMLMIVFPIFLFAQQKTEVQGRVLYSDGKGAQGITIKLIETNQTVSSNSRGQYVFRNVSWGQYTLSFSGIGLEDRDTSILVEGNKLQVPELTLRQRGEQLQEVVIEGQGTNRFSRISSSYVAKMPLKNLENPQSYAVVTNELLQSQVNINFDDALTNVSGVDKLWGSTGRPGDGTSYYSLRGFTAQPSMVNGVVSINSTSLDPSNIERIEVIKGPSGSLYGGAAIGFGGLINTVTKRPVDTLGGRINYIGGSYGQHRVTADLYGPLSADNKLSGRVNIAYNHTGTFQDAGYNKSFFITPSLLYKPNQKLDIQLDAEIYHGKATNPLMVFLNRSRQLYARNPNELQFDFGKSYTDNSVHFTNPSSTFRANASYRMSDSWTSNSSVSFNHRAADGYFQYVMYLQPENDTIIDRYAGYQDHSGATINAQQNFIGDFHLGNLRNRILVGVDYLMQRAENHNSPYVLVDQINTSINDPNYAKFNREFIDAAITSSDSPESNNRNRSQVFGAYVSDMLDITTKLHLNLALRMDYFDNKGTYNFDQDTTTGSYNQLAFSPRVGIVYELAKDKVSLFTNYQNGFKNVAPVVQPLPDISGDFKPQQASQFEAGVKLNLLSDRLGMTLSYYDITVDNMTRSDVIERDGQTYNITVQDGTRLSRGLDLDISAIPLQGMNVLLTYSYNDSKTTKAAESVNNLRPTEAGPTHLFNAWANYILPKGFVKGLGIGLGINHASENIITNSVPTGQFIIPSYTLLNASVSYSVSNYEFAVKGNNLTNKTYFKGWTTVNPSMPRNFLGSIAYRF